MTPQRTERLKEAPRSREDSITLQLTFPLSEKKKIVGMATRVWKSRSLHSSRRGDLFFFRFSIFTPQQLRAEVINIGYHSCCSAVPSESEIRDCPASGTTIRASNEHVEVLP